MLNESEIGGEALGEIQGSETGQTVGLSGSEIIDWVGKARRV